ncbi:protein of unknown function [Burkholderia multivorans]
MVAGNGRWGEAGTVYPLNPRCAGGGEAGRMAVMCRGAETARSRRRGSHRRYRGED